VETTNINGVDYVKKEDVVNAETNIAMKYSSLRTLATALVDEIIEEGKHEDFNSLTDMVYTWLEHGIDVTGRREWNVTATVTFDVELTVTAANEDEASDTAQTYLDNSVRMEQAYSDDDVEFDSSSHSSTDNIDVQQT
jgi:hypothetical protein